MENEQDPNARPNADDAFRDEPLSTESEGGGGDHAAPAGGLDEPTLMPGAMGPESDSSGTPFGDALPPSGDTSVADDPDGPTLKPTNLNHGNLVNEDSPIVAPTVDAPAAQPCNQSLPREFGDYELIEEIARGGMGVVFRARQQRLNRVVAIKMILTGQLAREEDIARFYTEAEAAASLDHQGIVPIYEVGCHEGQHFFSMGYVEGPSLTQMILERPAEASVAAELCRQVAVAVGYAHGRGVIHRDLKPANVLVARDESSNRDGELAPSAASVASLMGWSSNASPVSCGVAKVTDFGLAKNVEQQSELTATGQILGTPGYMPPEQAAGRIDEVDAVADVYSIGGILYALLTGRAPFQAATPLDTLMQVLEREPVAPRQLNANVPADLETICLKCLQKDPKRRYGSAAELADDLTRFLQGDPIEARPVTRIERAWRWARRHPAVAALGTTTAILIGVIATIAPLIAVRQSQLRVAEQSLRIEAVQLSEDLADAKDDTEANLYAARVKLAFQNFLDGSLPQMRKTLNEAPTAYRSWEWDFVSGLNGAGRLVLRGHPGEVLQVRFVPNEDESKPPQLLTIGSRMNARLWDLETGAPGRRVELATKTAMMDGDGKRSLGFVDDAAVVINHGQTVYPVLRFVVDGAPIVAVTMSADSRRGAVLRRTAIDEFSLHVHDTIDGSTIAGPWVLDPVSEPKLVFSQDGGRLALADFDPASKDSTRVHVWIDSAKEGWSVATLDTEATPTAIAWADRASTSKRLLVGDGRGYVRVHEVSDDEGTPIERTARVESEEAAVIGKPMMTLSGSGAGIMSLAYDPQSKRLAAACEDRQVVVWDDFASTTRSVLCGLEDRPTELSISSGGRFLASGSGFGAAVWKLPPEDALPLRQEAEPVALSPRPLGDIAIASSGDAFVLDRAGRVRRVNAATGDVSDSEMQRWLSGQQTFPGRKPPQRDPTIPGKLAISSDGRLMALSVSRFDQDPSTSKRRIRSSVVLWDLRARRPAGVLGEQNNVITGLAFSPSGDRLVTVTGIPDATKRAIERDD
ncbi:MAG: serine/threonine-protein kinase, partial [Planctomycetota bacterium]